MSDDTKNTHCKNIKNDSGLKVVLCLLGNLHSFLYLNFPLSALISVKYCWWMFIQAKELLVGNYRNMDFHSFTLIKGQLVEEEGKSRKFLVWKSILLLYLPQTIPRYQKDSLPSEKSDDLALIW